MHKISGCMITYNEEKVVRRTLENLSRFCDEIIVFDSYSTDSTSKILTNYGCKLFQHEFDNHRDQKNRAIEECTNEWIFLLDADEYCNNQLVDMLTSGLLIDGLETQGVDALGIPRYNLEDGVGPRGWPDIQTRLFKRHVRHAGHPAHHQTTFNARKPLVLNHEDYLKNYGDAMYIIHDKSLDRQIRQNKLYYAMNPENYQTLPQGVTPGFAAKVKGSMDPVNPDVYNQYIKVLEKELSNA